MNIKEAIQNNKELLFNVLRQLVSYKTIENKGEENTPFGVENKKCLNKILSLANKFGLKTKNLDNYCGYAEIGKGEDIIGIIVHLDIVPEGNGWDSNPFLLTEKNGYFYGRGTSDDKGAAACSLIAIKIINDLNINLNNKRVRLIFGCNEEDGFNCMKYYNKKEENFKHGFTPDAEFPCINGEKGYIKCIFKCSSKSIIDIKGGNHSNMVADICTISVANNSYNKEKFIKFLKDNKLTVDIQKKNSMDKITVTGKSSHASIPERGLNAITYTMYALKKSGFIDDFVQKYCLIFDLDNKGKNLNIACHDKYGYLTIVNGLIKKNGNQIEGTIDIRTPITLKQTSIINRINQIDIITIDDLDKPLYYAESSTLVKKLMKAYHMVTNDYNSKPKTTGGTTYAKAFNNCIAFGCSFSSDNNIHKANERVKISELLLQLELYIYAIMELVK